MGFMKSAMAALLGAVLVAGCGGGGGGSGGGSTPAPPPPVGSGPGENGAPPVTPGGSWLTLTPGTVSINTFEDEGLPFQVNARSSRTFDKPFNAAVIDSKGVISTDVRLTMINDLEYRVDLQTAGLQPGVHTTTLQVRLCEDDPLTCRAPLPGSPWYLPVTVKVASSAESKARLKLAPAAFDFVTYEGLSQPFTLAASAPTAFLRPVWVRVSDSAGLLAQKMAVPLGADGKLDMQLATAPGLAVGEHAGAIELRLCYDAAPECRSPVGGSPWSVPLKVSVKSNNNLTPLSAIDGLSSWNTYHASATQNAHVPAHFAPAAFSGRWLKPEVAGILRSAPVIENGRVFSIHVTVSTDKRELVAISEASGDELWRREIDVPAGALATGNGRVFVRTSAQDGAFLWAFDQASGQLLGKTRLNASFEMQAAPTVVGDMVYVGHSAGMEKIDAARGQVVWSNLSMHTMAPYWTPSVDAGLAYTVLLDAFFALNTADGSIASTFLDKPFAANASLITPLVLNGNLGVVANGVRVAAYDLQAHARIWMADTRTLGTPVVANGLVYTLGQEQRIEARSAATGVLQWKSAPVFDTVGETGNGRIIVTSNLIFVGGFKSTVALDLASHEAVWRYPAGGELAISERAVLYILSSSGRMAAINLR